MNSSRADAVVPRGRINRN